MINKTNIFARNLPVGSVVELYKEDWICIGICTFFDGTFEVQRVMLSSVYNSSRYTCVRLFHEFLEFGGCYHSVDKY